MKPYKLDNIILLDLSIYIKGTLIISDIHIGYEEALNKQGILIPRLQTNEMISKIQEIFQKLNQLKLPIKAIVVAGDLKHEFGKILNQEWNDTLKFLEILKKKTSDVIVIRGNHDVIIDHITKKVELNVQPYHIFDDICILHGDALPENIKMYAKDKNDFLIKFDKVKTIIMGHEHPAVGLNDGIRTEKFKCFLKGKYKYNNQLKDLIVIPSFFQITEGSDILKEKLLSPYLKNIDEFQILVVTDEIYDFGTVKKLLKKML